jgi:hypothetical protein
MSMQKQANIALGCMPGLVGLSMLLGCSSAAAEADLCPTLHITKSVVGPEVSDLGEAIRREAGPHARPAEWGEIKVCYQKHGVSYFHQLGVAKTDPRNKSNPPGSQVLVVVNGNRYFQAGKRAYFAAFNEGTLPFDFLAHDQVGGNQISLGSWYYPLPAFYILDQHTTTSKAAPISPEIAARGPEVLREPRAHLAEPNGAAGFSHRVALAIGNASYKFANVLANPVNDASDIAAVLRKLDFDVVEGKNLDRRGFDDSIREFGRKLEHADLAIFFYAGHGLQVGGRNYLVPIDAKLDRPGDLALDAVDLSIVLAQMEAERRVNLVFLDACRDNPLARTLARSLGARSTSVGQGLASIQSAIGTMITYATQPDNVALDGEGRNSPFTAALLKHIADRGVDIGTVMRRVRSDVVTVTREKQVPWDHSSLVGEVVLRR